MLRPVPGLDVCREGDASPGSRRRLFSYHCFLWMVSTVLYCWILYCSVAALLIMTSIVLHRTWGVTAGIRARQHIFVGGVGYCVARWSRWLRGLPHWVAQGVQYAETCTRT